MSPVRVGINGFGRIGRCVVRAATKHRADIEFVAVNDMVEPATLAHLVAYDSVYGPLDDVSVDGQGIIVGAPAKLIRALSVSDPAKLPWSELKADVVIESTGRFASREDAVAHLDAGARKVIISAPGKDADATVVLGVNFDAVSDREICHVISNASCTTNSLVPVAKGAAKLRLYWAVLTQNRAAYHPAPVTLWLTLAQGATNNHLQNRR
jgi:glyceraldehyde 3-phosphate dehydrogenase